MQTIFYNSNIMTFDENNLVAQAFLVNDGSIVIVGTNDEILSMKTEETKLVDLEGKTVVPSFYDTNARIYDLIENEIKNANLSQFLENNEEIDENYDKFANFEVYKNYFLSIQEDYLANGITTIFEMNLNSKEFTFWKKLSESGELKIDVIGFVNMHHNREVMDNNCRSYRTYKKHFRLGGYYIKIDDELWTKKAWLTKPYKRENYYVGYTNLVDMQLSLMIKTALEDKKQLIIEANGDNAVEQLLRCFKENVKEETTDTFKPILKNCNFISKKYINDMKFIKISPSFQINDISEYGKLYKDCLGSMRASKLLPVKMVLENEIEFLLNSKQSEIPNIFRLAMNAENRVYDNNKVLGKKYSISFDDAFKSLIVNSSSLAFDNGFKGSIENGKKANFVVLSDTLENIKLNKITEPILKTFVEGEQLFTI